VATKRDTSASGANSKRFAETRADGERLFEAESLRAAATKFCEREFHKRFGIQWDQHLLNTGYPGPDTVEQEALAILGRLRKAFRELGRFIERTGGTESKRLPPPAVGRGRPTALSLHSLYWELGRHNSLGGLLALQVERASSSRTALADELVHLQQVSALPRLHPLGAIPTTRDAAAISILLGNWPNFPRLRDDGLTCREVVGLEEKAMRIALSRAEKEAEKRAEKGAARRAYKPGKLTRPTSQ